MSPLVNMIRKIDINESVWADIHRRSNGTQERKEDIPTNIKNIVPVDMGVSVLWADQDLEFKDGNVFFTYDEAIDCIKNTDWRLPTRKEYDELITKTQLLVNTDYEYSCQGKGVTGTDLHFYKKGLKYSDDNMVHNSTHYYSWTSTKATQYNNTYLTNVFRQYQTMQPMHFWNKVCVRLVKDIK